MLLALPVGAMAHEFWIEPLAYQVEDGGKLQAHFRNGENFEGGTYAFFDRSSTRFDVIVDGTATPVTPRSGDSPAFDIEPPITDGLISVVHETSASFVTYSDWAKFLKFAAHKDFTTAADEHAAKGWSQVKFRERYTRHVKSLMTVGSGEGADSEAGLKTEFIALSNPYSATFDKNMKVKLMLDGAPRPDAQVEVFDRAPDDSVTVTLHRTDAQGIATIPVEAGHEYLFDAVTLRPAPDATADENAVVWETYWAALTFTVPQ